MREPAVFIFFRQGPMARLRSIFRSSIPQFMPHTVNIYTGDAVKWNWMGHGYSKPPGGFLHFWRASRLIGRSVQAIPLPISSTWPGTFRYDCIPPCSVGKAGTVNVAEPLSGVNISVTPTSVNFGNISIGQSSDQIVTIAYLSSSTTVLNGVVLNPSAPFFCGQRHREFQPLSRAVATRYGSLPTDGSRAIFRDP